MGKKSQHHPTRVFGKQQKDLAPPYRIYVLTILTATEQTVIAVYAWSRLKANEP